jgi:hypothetical protein
MYYERQIPFLKDCWPSYQSPSGILRLTVIIMTTHGTQSMSCVSFPLALRHNGILGAVCASIELLENFWPRPEGLGIRFDVVDKC